MFCHVSRFLACTQRSSFAHQVVNDEFLGHVRTGRCEYIRGDIDRLVKRGVRVNVRERNSKPGDEGDIKVVSHISVISCETCKLTRVFSPLQFDADVVVMATGFHKPDISFLPDDLFPKGYDVRIILDVSKNIYSCGLMIVQRPNLYLQNFPTEDWSILMTNSAYMNAIGKRNLVLDDELRY